MLRQTAAARAEADRRASPWAQHAEAVGSRYRSGRGPRRQRACACRAVSGDESIYAAANLRHAGNVENRQDQPAERQDPREGSARIKAGNHDSAWLDDVHLLHARIAVQRGMLPRKASPVGVDVSEVQTSEHVEPRQQRDRSRAEPAPAVIEDKACRRHDSL